MDRLKEKELARRRRRDKFKRRNKKRKDLLDRYSDWGFEFRESFLNWINEKAIREGDIRTKCSCPMCGNPRKHFDEKTKAEILFDQKYREELENVKGQAKTDE